MNICHLPNRIIFQGGSNGKNPVPSVQENSFAPNLDVFILQDLSVKGEYAKQVDGNIYFVN